MSMGERSSASSVCWAQCCNAADQNPSETPTSPAAHRNHPTRTAPTPRRQISTVKKSPGPPRPPPRPRPSPKTQNPLRALPPVPTPPGRPKTTPQGPRARVRNRRGFRPSESCPDACANLRAAATPRRRPRQGGVVRLRCISPPTPSRCPARQPKAESDSCSPDTSHGHRSPPRPDVSPIETRHFWETVDALLDGPFIVGQRPPPARRDRRDEP